MGIESKSRIAQIIPATGWWAVYESPDGTERWPLICWILKDSTTIFPGESEPWMSQEVIGLVQELGSAVVNLEADEDLEEGFKFKYYDYNPDLRIKAAQ